jgi:hypothetical protein
VQKSGAKPPIAARAVQARNMLSPPRPKEQAPKRQDLECPILAAGWLGQVGNRNQGLDSWLGLNDGEVEIRSGNRVRVQRTGLLRAETSTKPRDDVSKFRDKLPWHHAPLGLRTWAKVFASSSKTPKPIITRWFSKGGKFHARPRNSVALKPLNDNRPSRF